MKHFSSAVFLSIMKVKSAGIFPRKTKECISKMIVKKPPMGWNSWNTFTEDINEQMIMETADAMVAEGLRDAGYEYLVIDDCWAERERDEHGMLVASHTKFPHGMKYVADYVHSKGLKFGMYSCDGTLTCAGYPASLGHEFDDAQYFASVGVDYLKYDNCYKPGEIAGQMLYNRMSMALKATGRDIVFSACNWGMEHVETWIRSTGAHLYRSTGDITDTYESMRDIAVSQLLKLPYSGPGCFNDIDMLITGLQGKGNIGFGKGCTDTEYRMHFALWCFYGAPLMIGADVRTLTPENKALLTNKALLELDQDEDCRPPFVPVFDSDNHPERFRDEMKLFRHLANGDYAFGLFNWSDDRRQINQNMYSIGLPEASKYGFELTDLFTGEPVGKFNEIFRVTIPAHDCRLYRAKLVPMK